MPKVKEIIERLQGYNPESHIAVAIWSEEDVIWYAENQMDVVISIDKAQDILDDIDRHQDCEWGITWESIRTTIQDSLPPDKD